MSSDLIPMGDGAWRLTLPEGTDPAAALGALRALPRVLDAVVTGRTALVRFDPAQPPEDPRPAVTKLSPLAEAQRHHHVISVRYDGPDLDSVSQLTGLSRAEVIALHCERDYAVELVGFLPGFAYLGPVDGALYVPRRATPRPRVPAGAVGLAAGRTGVYPFSSPGGWQLIGTAVGFVAFDAERGSTLALGDRVRFVPISP